MLAEHPHLAAPARRELAQQPLQGRPDLRLPGSFVAAQYSRELSSARPSNHASAPGPKPENEAVSAPPATALGYQLSAATGAVGGPGLYWRPCSAPS